MKLKHKLMVENFNLVNENERIKTELDSIKYQWLTYKHITDKQLNNLRKNEDKEIKEKRKLEEDLYKNIQLLAKTNNICMQQAQRIEQLEELNEDLAHILKDYKESEKEENELNEMWLNKLKNTFGYLYNNCECCYKIPLLKLVNNSCFINVDFEFLEDYKFMVTNRYTKYIGNINEIKL